MQITSTSNVGANARPFRFTSYSPGILSQNVTSRLSADVFTSSGRAQLQPKVRFSGNEPNPEIEVPMGNFHEVVDNAHSQVILTTKSLMDCSALVYLGNYDPAKDEYQTRILSHIMGSSLDLKVSNNERGGDLVLRMLTMARRDPTARMCLVYGAKIPTYDQASILSQYYNNVKPIEMGRNILKERFETKQGADIRVTPNGAVEITRSIDRW